MARALAIAFVATLLCATGCASRAHSSEAAWQRAQCNQINDEEARKKCLQRVDSEYGRK